MRERERDISEIEREIEGVSERQIEKRERERVK